MLPVYQNYVRIKGAPCKKLEKKEKLKIYTKRVIRNRKSKKDRQYDDQKKKKRQKDKP